MSHAQYHAVQLFARNAQGALSAMKLRECGSAESAKRVAEQFVRQKKAVGALAFSCAGGSSADEYSTPTFLARFGDVPESDDY